MSNYVSIQEASRITGVEVATLREWEKQFGDHLEPWRLAGGQRRYDPANIQTVFLLKQLLQVDKLSLLGAHRHLERT